MAQFILYSYQFAPHIKFEHDQIGLFGEIMLPSANTAMDNKQSTFFSTLLSTTFMHGNRKLKTQILYSENNVILFRLANLKTITREKDFIKQEEINEPSILIFIDNNNGIQRIAIEENKMIFSDTSVVTGIIRKSTHKSLERNNLTLSIKREFTEREFWETMNLYSDKVTMLSFTFVYPNLPRSREVLSETLKSFTKDIGGASAKAQIEAENGTILHIDQSNKNIENLVKEAANTGNLIKFKITGERTIKEVGKSTKKCNIDLTGEDTTNNILSLIDQLKDFTGDV